jgi:hypothetical protein
MSINSSDELPESLWGEIYDYLPLDDRVKLVACVCKSFKKMQSTLDQHVTCALVTTSLHTRIVSERLHLWKHLVELNMTSFATDHLLLQMKSPLTRLIMVGSIGITNGGLSRWCGDQNPSRPTDTLQYIDLTYCSKTTYAGTFPLRNAFPGLIIRRQPEWMDGHFVTPFDNDGLHTYWCDGTFQFEREQQSCGHVTELFQQDENCPDHVGDKLQYTNFVPPDGWPDWSRYCYRPGVSLFKLDYREGEERSIMVGQCLYGIRPPRDYPKPEHVHVVPLHASRYFDRDGKLLEEGHPIEQRHVMVSRMKVLPLEDLMPPARVVEQNWEFLSRLPLDLYLERGEEFLHHALNRA